MPDQAQPIPAVCAFLAEADIDVDAEEANGALEVIFKAEMPESAEVFAGLSDTRTKCAFMMMRALEDTFW